MFKYNRLALINASIFALCIVSSVAIGFASWTISNNDLNTTSGNIKADVQVNGIRGVTVEFARAFTLNTYHFDNQENDPSKTGDLCFNLSVDYSEVYEDVIDQNGYACFKILLSFGDNSTNLFSSSFYQGAIIDTQDGVLFERETIASSSYVSYIFKTNSDYINKSLTFTFKNTILRYRNQLMANTFYLSFEGVIQ